MSELIQMSSGDCPRKYETEIVLRDGSRAILRPIRTDDVEQWLAFVSRLSIHSKYFRFHNVPREMGTDDAIRYCTVDYHNTFALVAEVTREQRREIVAIGRYYRLPGKPSAEVALAVDDIYHGQGIGTKLLEWLAVVAFDNGITSFEAEVLAENEEMMTVFRECGFHVTSELKFGVYHVTFPIPRNGRNVEERGSLPSE